MTDHGEGTFQSGDLVRAHAQREVRARRAAAALRYRPDRVRTLLVAEAPPSDPSRYFYFENVTAHDGLFRSVCEVVLGYVPQRHEKAAALSAMHEHGIFLIDLNLDPIEGGDRNHLPGLVLDLVDRARRLDPGRVIVIKATVWDLVSGPLRAAGLNLVEERIPFPGSGQQAKFRIAFGRALSA